MYLKGIFLFCMISFFGFAQNPVAKQDTIPYKDTVKVRPATVPISMLKEQPQIKPDVFALGLGFGLDFGGLGINLTAYPQKNIGIFGGAGIAFAGFGYNVGAKCRYISYTSQKKVQISPFLVAMYGYNAAIVIINATNYNRLFYGPSFGFGFDVRFKRGYISASMLVPIRGSDVDNYINNLQVQHNVQLQNDLLPVAFSIGYKFILNYN